MEGRNGGRLRQDPSARDRQLGPAVWRQVPREPASAFAWRRTILETRGLAVLGPKRGAGGSGWRSVSDRVGGGQKTWGLGGRIPKVGRKVAW